MVRRSVVCFGTLLAAVGCGDASSEQASDTPQVNEAQSELNAAQPEVPALSRDVAMIAGSKYTHPTTPAFRTSADGRVALNLKGLSGKPAFYLLAPEKLTAPFAASAPGTPMLASTTSANFGVTDAMLNKHDPLLGAGSVTHRTLCDATSNFPAQGAKENPYACGVGSASDCYDLTVISTVEYTDASAKRHIELWGTPVTVRVDNPKTALATLGNITSSTPVLGPTWNVTSFFEGMVNADGHLLVGRVGGSSLTWPSNNGPVTGTYDIVYAPGNTASAPCDVRQWTQTYPISHAPYDATMQARGYGFAQYPLRDPEGTVLADGVDLKATYPWMDRQGRNLFFMSVSSTLFYWDPTANGGLGAVKTRYPTACVPGQACVAPTTSATLGDADSLSHTRGVTVAGLWTHGKMVLIDNLLNNVDYGVHVPDLEERVISLYQPSTGPLGNEPGSARIGAGRDNGATGWPAGATFNTTFVDSTEHLFNHLPNADPITVRDVVWTMNSGRGSDELAFDDYLDPDGFIVSEMAASMSFSGGPIANEYWYHDGFVRTSTSNGTGFSDAQEVRIQNAATATSDRWVIPAYGKVTGGARLEPAALGGIRGKGLWLDGADDGISYTVPAPPVGKNMATAPVYASVFLDSRFADDAASRRLFTFPDGSRIDLIGGHAVAYVDGLGATAATISLPTPLATKGFSHLGFTADNSGKRVKLYLDGFLLNTWTSTTIKLFRLTQGTFSVGAVTGVAGVRGWIDELKIILRVPDQEVVCNHARGTLIGLPAGYAGSWAPIAARYPAGSHNVITTRLTTAGEPTFAKYACFHDYANETGAHLGNIPSGTTSIRRSITFPEGPLVYNTPRPDVSTNAFCVSCHVAGQPSSLSPSALTLSAGVMMQNDQRRQPLQPPRLIFGNVPAGYVPTSGLPATAQRAPAAGLELDAWVFP
jgi:hypothetical protein